MAASGTTVRRHIHVASGHEAQMEESSVTERLFLKLRSAGNRHRLVLSFVAALTASVVATGVAQAAPQPLPSDEGQGGMSAVQLTPDQAQALLRAKQQEQHMTPQRARQVIESAGAVTTLDEGYDSATGDCSSLFLYGQDDGLYHFRQNIFPGYGEPWVGDVNISTDGIGSFVHEYALTPADGDQQRFNATIGFMGMDPDGHTMDGWMLTTEYYYCSTDLSRELYAKWQ
jgi:hypothetical protein